MKQTNFTIKNRKITRVNQVTLTGSYNVDTFKFDFDDEWSGLDKTLVILSGDETYNISLLNDACVLPLEAYENESIQIGLFGKKADNSIILSSIMLDLDINEGAYRDGEEPDNLPTQSQWDVYVAQINSLLSQANATKQQCDSVLAELKSYANTSIATMQSLKSEMTNISNQFNSNATAKLNTYNTNAETKTTSYNENATNKTNDFNTNASTKKTEINEIATSVEQNKEAVSTMKTSVENTVTAFNTNAEIKLTNYNTNATTKLNAYNENASNKINAYNENASNKINAYNTNASDKTSAYNENATEKTTEFNSNASEKKAEIVTINNELTPRIEDLETEVLNLENALDISTATSENEEIVVYAKPYKLMSTDVSGKTVQGENPTPDNPQEIENLKAYNLLNATGLTELVKNGLTFTPVYNSNGRLEYINVNGTATSGTWYADNRITFTFEANVEYILSGCPQGGGANTYNMYHGQSSNNRDYGNGATIIETTTVTKQVAIFVKENQTLNNLKFKPMIRLASVNDNTFIPYGNIAMNTHSKNLCPGFEKNIALSLVSGIASVKEGEYYTTDYIAVDYSNDAKYTMSSNVNGSYCIIWAYNSNKEAIKRSGGGIGTSKKITNASSYTGGTGSGTSDTTIAYVRIHFYPNANATGSITIDNGGWVQFEKNSTVISYEPYASNQAYIDLDGNELAKVGTVADKLLIDKKGNVAIEKNTGKVVLNGSENWSKNGDSPDGNFISFYIYGAWARNQIALSDYFIGKLWDITTSKNEDSCWSSTTSCGFRINKENLNGYNSSMTNTEKIQLFKNWLSAHNTTVQYVLATPTLIPLPKITPLSTLKGKNYITIESNIGSTDFEVEYVEDLAERIKAIEQAIVSLGSI